MRTYVLQFNPIPTRLCHVIYCHGEKSYPCLVGIGLSLFEVMSSCERFREFYHALFRYWEFIGHSLSSANRILLFRLEPKLYIPSTVNTDYLMRHKQLIPLCVTFRVTLVRTLWSIYCIQFQRKSTIMLMLIFFYCRQFKKH